jgi:hypothetical protein
MPVKIVIGRLATRSEMSFSLLRDVLQLVLARAAEVDEFVHDSSDRGGTRRPPRPMPIQFDGTPLVAFLMTFM